MRKIKRNKSKKVSNILDLAGSFKAPKGMNALKAREYMQTHYKRF